MLSLAMPAPTQLSHPGFAHALRGEGQRGFVLYEGFSDRATGDSMLGDVVTIARDAAASRDVSPAFVMKESQPGFSGDAPEDLISKIFRLHRRGPFRRFLEDPRVVAILVDALGPDVDCFLSQFIFKNPGAWGQPWHQDSYYFHFEPARPIVGLWLAISEATLENGCLHVLAGSQMEPLKRHVPDERPGSLYGYVEIADHDMSDAQPCLLAPGDLLVFDSHLMHRSTDNLSNGIRAAMVWHFSRTGTIDLGADFGDGVLRKSPVNDWVPVVRGGAPVRGENH